MNYFKEYDETDPISIETYAKQLIGKTFEIKRRNGKNYNNFPKSTENPVCHVRPHAQNSKDTYELPDGRQYPKQCFWLNNSYILSQLDDRFKEE